MYNVIIIIIYNYKYEHSNIKDFSKERYNTHTKSCHSILYTKTNSR